MLSISYRTSDRRASSAMRLSRSPLAEAAARFGYTPAYISRALKRATGQSFLQLRQTRCMVRAAALLLAEPDCAVTAVAERVGIRNVTQFYRLFSQRYEMTPREYRRRFEEK